RRLRRGGRAGGRCRRSRGGGGRRRGRGPRGGRGGGGRRRGRGPGGGRGGGGRRRGRGAGGGRGGGGRGGGGEVRVGRGGGGRRCGGGRRRCGGGGGRRRGRGRGGGRGGGRCRRGRGPRGGRGRGTRRRDRQAERPLCPAVPVDDDEVRLPRGHRRRDAGGAEQATRVGARIVVAPGRHLGPARADAAAQVEDGVEARAGAARLDGRRARDRRRPLIDPLGRVPRAAAAARQRARAARRAAEGPARRGDDGRAAAVPRQRGGDLTGLALADRDTLSLAAPEHALPARPGVAPGGDA